MEFNNYLKQVEKDIRGIAQTTHISGLEREDIEQEMRLVLFKQFKTWKGESSFRTWAIRVMRNKIKNLAKYADIRPTLVNASDIQRNYENKEGEYLNVYEEILATDKGKHAKQMADNVDILDAIEELPERQRDVINLHIYEDFTFKEIAKELGISERTAKSDWQKAKEVLGERLEDFIG